jgi:hypothetical protein
MDKVHKPSNSEYYDGNVKHAYITDKTMYVKESKFMMKTRQQFGKKMRKD